MIVNLNFYPNACLVGLAWNFKGGARYLGLHLGPLHVEFFNDVWDKLGD